MIHRLMASMFAGCCVATAMSIALLTCFGVLIGFADQVRRFPFYETLPLWTLLLLSSIPAYRFERRMPISSIRVVVISRLHSAKAWAQTTTSAAPRALPKQRPFSISFIVFKAAPGVRIPGTEEFRR